MFDKNKGEYSANRPPSLLTRGMSGDQLTQLASGLETSGHPEMAEKISDFLTSRHTSKRGGKS